MSKDLQCIAMTIFFFSDQKNCKWNFKGKKDLKQAVAVDLFLFDKIRRDLNF